MLGVAEGAENRLRIDMKIDDAIQQGRDLSFLFRLRCLEFSPLFGCLSCLSGYLPCFRFWSWVMKLLVVADLLG